MIPDYNIEIWRTISGVCTQIDIDANIVNPPEPRPEDPEELEIYAHNFLISELISIKATQTVAGQVAEAEVVFDNDPTKKFEAGDIVLIWLGWEGSTLQKIFSGVVYEAAKYSSDEDKTLTLRVKDWSFLLLTDKFTHSYPGEEGVSEYARQIVLDILGDYGSSSPIGLCEYKVGISSLIESRIPPQTRQLDFDGEPLIDAMTKVSDATENDWYIDEEKMVRWFERRDLVGLEHRQDRNGESPPSLILQREDLTNYNVTDPEELLCNKVSVYGRNNKCIPWDLDLWTEPSTTGWTGLSNCTVSLVTGSGEEVPKAGTLMIKIGNPASSWLSWDQSEGWIVTCTRPLGCIGNYDMPFSCPSGREIYLRKAGAEHSGSGSIAVSYKFAPNIDSGFWIQIGTSWSGGYQERCLPASPGTCPGTPDHGSTNQNLYVRFALSLGWLQTGTISNFHIEYQYSGTYEKLSARFTLPIGDFPDGLDLDPKQAPQKLIFVIGSNVDILTPSSGMPQLNVLLKFADGSSATFRAQYTGIKQNQWSTVEIPIGPNASQSGWTGIPTGKLIYIEFEYLLSKPAEDTDYILIDWLHFDEARWFGEREDVTSQDKNGIRFKELFDDTLYSDTAASRRAVEYVKKFKDPIVTIKDVEVEYIGMERLDPGKILFISDTIPEFIGLSVANRTYRIETIEHHWEENEYYVRLVLSLDPIYFEGNVYQISERVRRIEQRGTRKPAANPTEVD